MAISITALVIALLALGLSIWALWYSHRTFKLIEEIAVDQVDLQTWAEEETEALRRMLERADTDEFKPVLRQEFHVPDDRYSRGGQADG